MSKQHSLIILSLVIAVLGAVSPAGVRAQPVSAVISINAEDRSVLVEGGFGKTAGVANLSFLKNSIGIPDLGVRISEIKLTDAKGEVFNARRLNSTEFLAERPFVSFSYKVHLAPPSDARSAAHASWLNNDLGLLMIDDLLPLTGKGKGEAAIKIGLPPDWKLLTAENVSADLHYRISDMSRAVFAIGKDIRESRERIGIATAGRWHFTDAEVGAIGNDIFNEYVRIFENTPGNRPQIILMPFPQTGVNPGTWEAETRGSTVILVSADTPFKSQSLQRLHEQLRHELFHLWMPNGVSLTGRYDWFYEGFALYQSLKTAVAMNQIRFDDLLDTLSRAYNIGRSQRPLRSLIEASEQRFNGGETELYARGMIAAFLCDLAILEASKGKNSIEDVFRDVFAKYGKGAAGADGNEAVIASLGRYPATGPIVSDHIRGAKAFEWTDRLAAVGLENPPGSPRVALRVVERPGKGQRALLDKLGYNNWRKLNRK